MAWLNTNQSYGLVSKALHWVIVLLLLIQIFGGLLYTSGVEWVQQAPHEIIGKIILGLAIARIFLKLSCNSPKPLESHKKWEVRLSQVVHWALYAVLFIYPTSGWMMVSAGEFAETGALPTWVTAQNSDVFWYQFHVNLKWSLLALVCLHVAGALKHVFIDRDTTLKRIWFS
ncbi:MAG: cytochrome b [Alphaproteobacteria bacterium]